MRGMFPIYPESTVALWFRSKSADVFSLNVKRAFHVEREAMFLLKVQIFSVDCLKGKGLHLSKAKAYAYCYQFPVDKVIAAFVSIR
ncbi:MULTISPECIES: hypothetical protein [unclassified Bartonella]|uniref:hypothetical protein n=1 Tax=unclassified Bartonella TaxID=2645622 RepID=UPI0035CFBD60